MNHGVPPTTDNSDSGDAPGDDAVIGVAFRRSLWVIGIIALLVIVGYLLSGSLGTSTTGQSIDVQSPESVIQGSEAPDVVFTDVTSEAGIDFVHYNGAYGEKLLPETMGGGVAVFDYDQDGDQDLLFTNSSPWPNQKQSDRIPTLKLYANDGEGSFQDETAAAGLSHSFYGMGAAVGDYDSDGWPDLFISAVGRNHLYRNEAGVFRDVTVQAAVGGDEAAWSTSAGFFDYDNDGDYDLFVANYVQWSREIDLQIDFRLAGVGRAYGPPQEYAGTFNYLYRNEGNGAFTDVSGEAGIRVENPASGVPAGKGLAISPMDIDRDGWIDLFVANDTVRNFFFHNNGDGTFEETAEIYGLSYGPDGDATGAMGVDAGYFRNSEAVGVVVGNFANEMTSFFVSQGDPALYMDDAIGEGVGAPSRRVLTFGLFLFDYDLDGRLDLLQANGHIEAKINEVDPSQTYRQTPQLFWNGGPAVDKFVHIAGSDSGDLNQKLAARGAAYGDFDADGDLDVILAQVGGSAVLLRNDQSTGNHWIRVHLIGRPTAIGAWIELTSGDVTQRRQVMPTRSYLSQVEQPVTFGLGASTEVLNLNVIWPDGFEQSIADVSVDRTLTVTRSP